MKDASWISSHRWPHPWPLKDHASFLIDSQSLASVLLFSAHLELGDVSERRFWRAPRVSVPATSGYHLLLEDQGWKCLTFILHMSGPNVLLQWFMRLYYHLSKLRLIWKETAVVFSIHTLYLHVESNLPNKSCQHWHSLTLTVIKGRWVLYPNTHMALHKHLKNPFSQRKHRSHGQQGTHPSGQFL